MTAPSIIDRTESSYQDDWTRANQRYLTAHLGRLRALLRGYCEQGSQPDGVTSSQHAPTGPAPSMTHAQPAALDLVCERFGLSPFERDLLLLCAGIELDAAFVPLCAAAQGDAGWGYPTFALALAVLPEAHWSALTPEAPLRRWELVHVEPGLSLTRSALRIDERILHYLAGVDHLDAGLAGVMQPAHDLALLAPSQRAQAAAIEATWLAAVGSGHWPLVHLFGAGRDVRRAVAERCVPPIGSASLCAARAGYSAPACRGRAPGAALGARMAAGRTGASGRD